MGTNSNKIGMFVGYYPPHVGGVERYADKLSGALEKLGYTVVIVTSNNEDQAEYEKVGSRAIYRLPIRNVAKNKYPIPKKNDAYRRLITRIEAEDVGCYLLHTRFHLTSLIGAKMGKRLGRQVLLLEHGTGHFTVNNRLFDFFGCIYEHVLTGRIKKYVTKFYGVSKNCNVWLKHFSIKADGIFYNAITVADSRVASDTYEKLYHRNEIVVTYAGRLIKEKGVLSLLEAFIKVKKNNPRLNLRLVVAGDGSLLQYIQENYDDPAIALLGRLTFQQIMSLYRRTDIFVYPSLYPEGLPTSILEAGLMNCAVIATPRGGTEEVIVNKQHGIIVDGSTESLGDAIERLAKDSHEMQSLAATLNRRVTSVFNWNKVAKEVIHEINAMKAE